MMVLRESRGRRGLRGSSRSGRPPSFPRRADTAQSIGKAPALDDRLHTDSTSPRIGGPPTRRLRTERDPQGVARVEARSAHRRVAEEELEEPLLARLDVDAGGEVLEVDRVRGRPPGADRE